MLAIIILEMLATSVSNSICSKLATNVNNYDFQEGLQLYLQKVNNNNLPNPENMNFRNVSNYSFQNCWQL